MRFKQVKVIGMAWFFSGLLGLLITGHNVLTYEEMRRQNPPYVDSTEEIIEVLVMLAIGILTAGGIGLAGCKRWGRIIVCIGGMLVLLYCLSFILFAGSELGYGSLFISYIYFAFSGYTEWYLYKCRYSQLKS